MLRYGFRLRRYLVVSSSLIKELSGRPSALLSATTADDDDGSDLGSKVSLGF